MFEHRRQPGFIDVDAEKVRNASKLPFKVINEIVKVQQQHIRQPAHFPPATDVIPEGWHRESWQGVVVEPMQVIVPHVTINGQNWWATTIWCAVHQVASFLRETQVMVEHAPNYVPRIAAYIKVADARIDDERIAWEVALDAAPVPLRLELHEHLREGRGPIQPRRKTAPGFAVQTRLPSEDELEDELLRKGSSGFRPGYDDDVVIPEPKPIPTRGVE
jgi:hypothetical protein